MEVEFRNVTITLRAESAKDAYTRLCDALRKLDGCDWDTDTYVVYPRLPSDADDAEAEERDTVELFEVYCRGCGEAESAHKPDRMCPDKSGHHFEPSNI
jgi:hypothetical protein